MFILFFVISFLILAFPISLSIWWNLILLILSMGISFAWFWRYTIKIEGQTITFPQQYGWTRKMITPEDITKIMFRYYYPNKRSTNRGIRGYKLNLGHNSRTYIKLLAHEFSFQAKYEIFSFILKENPTIEQNKRFQQDLLFLTHKVEMKNKNQ